MTDQYGPAGETPATPPTLPYGVPPQPAPQAYTTPEAYQAPAPGAYTPPVSGMPPASDPFAPQPSTYTAPGAGTDPAPAVDLDKAPAADATQQQSVPPVPNPFAQAAPGYAPPVSGMPPTLSYPTTPAYPAPVPGMPPQGYAAPQPGYAPPVSGMPQGYAAPQPGYAPPVSGMPPGYAAPVSGMPQGYAAQGYAAPVSGAQAGAIQPYTAPMPPAPPGFGGHPAFAYGQNVNPYAVQYNLVSVGGRLGAAVLDVLLVFVTLGIGYLIWAAIVFTNGQTPGKQLLGHVVVDRQSGTPFTWGKMFLREVVVRGLLGAAGSAITCGIYPLVDACWIFGGQARETLHDKIVNSAVVYRTA